MQTFLNTCNGTIGDSPGLWDLVKDEVYSRSVDGRELVLYVNGSLKQSNIWGIGNEGYLTNADEPYFYLKDHLGSIRALTNDKNEVISSQDGACPRMFLAGDAWGYLLQGRQYDSDESVYKFTGKERDAESEYDYFGARYYDARIGRWGQVEPLLEKYVSFSPYSYALLNPLVFKDINGRDAIAEIDEKNKRIRIKIYLNYSKFSKKNKEGLNKNQINFLKDLKNEVEELWSGEVEYNNTEFNVVVQVILQEFKSFEEISVSTKIGENFVMNASSGDIIHGDVGLGTTPSGFFISKDFSLRKYSASHEIGHLLGLPDLGQENRSIMGYHPERVSPKASSRQEVLQKANLKLTITGPQIIRGNER